jgi:hypothetical protein
MPVPRTMRRSTVSAWSSAVWPTATVSARSPLGDEAEELVAQLACDLFDAAARFPRAGGDIAFPRHAFQAPLGSDAAHELQVLARVRA